MMNVNSLLNVKRIQLFVVCNVLFMLYALHDHLNIHGFLLSILINLMVFIIPGLVWTRLFHIDREDIVLVLFYDIVLSTVILGIGILLFYLLNVKVSSYQLLLYLIITTNIGLVICDFSKGIFLFKINKKVFVFIFLTFLTIYSASYYASVYWIAPLEDSDIELQGTSYGLMNSLKPYMLTDRGTIYYFAHPILVHFYSAYTILFSDSLEHMKYYYDAALEGQEIQEQPLQVNEEIVFKRPNGKRVSRTIIGLKEGQVSFNYAIPSEIEVSKNTFVSIKSSSLDSNLTKRQKLWPLVAAEYEEFRRNPQLLPTRMANIFISAISGVVLFTILFDITLSVTLAFFGTVLYFTFPEILFFSTGEIYTAITNFALLVCAYFYNKEKAIGATKGTGVTLFLVGGFMALSNHKAVLFPLALFVREILLNITNEPWRQRLKSIAVNKIILGFISGSLMFWAYGLLIDPNTFINEHIKNHLVNRIFHINVLGYDNYPTVIELWKTFANNSGYIFILLATVSVGFLLWHMRTRGRSQLIYPVWSLVGAIIFSIVDWRQTVHLSLIMPALLISVFLFISMQRQHIRVVCFAGLLFCLIRNISIMPEAIVNYGMKL